MICSRSVCSMWRRAGEKAAVFISVCLPVSVKSVSVLLVVLSFVHVILPGMLWNRLLPEKVLPDSLALLAQNEYEALLDEASDYANEAYYCNVDGEYELALQYIDSAMYCPEQAEHYKQYAILYIAI